MASSRSSTDIETTLLDDASGRAREPLRFSPALERQFLEWYTARNLSRARAATAIYLGLLVVMTVSNVLGTMAPLAESVLQPIHLLRIAVACPALALILAATFLPTLQRLFQPVATAAILMAGISIMWTSALEATSGNPLYQMGNVLVLVYATLFLGLLFRRVMTVAIGLVVAFLIVGFIIGLPGNDLAFSAAVLVATALMSVLSALRMENLVRANFFETQLLNNIAERDGLSGLYNRRMFDTLADRLWQQAQRDKQSLQVVLVDIDDFKLFNDHYGHQAGDHCIRRVATIISRAARRPLDFCARYGGEEFALVLFAPSGAEPTATGEQIRQGTLDLRIPHSHSSVAGFVSVSVGSAIATPGSKRSLAGLIQAADEALYLAKQSGRNRVLHVDADTSATRTGSFRVASAR